MARQNPSLPKKALWLLLHVTDVIPLPHTMVDLYITVVKRKDLEYNVSVRPDMNINNLEIHFTGGKSIWQQSKR